jgi:DNA-binding CsgD family transcriptional regulator/PAS domain-containing protein
MRSDAEQSLGERGWNAVREPFGETLRSLTSRLNTSTVGVALFDKGLHCGALNGAFARMNGAPVSAHIGKTIHQVFGKEVSMLEPVFQRVWATGNSLSNFDWTAQFPARTEASRWLVNFYPIKDIAGQVRLVATTFSEVTKRSSVELQLCRLTDKFRADVLGEPNLFGEEFAELSARTLELVKRSVELLKSSTSLRCYVSETRIGTGLGSLDLFLAGTREQESMSHPALPRIRSGASPPAHPESPNQSELPVGCPSPRERQVLHLLADGKSNKEIGSALEISARTVECYRARIMTKLDLHSTAALVRYAIRHNIVDA